MRSHDPQCLLSLSAKQSLELPRDRDSLSAAETTTMHTGLEELLEVATRVMTKILLREKEDIRLHFSIGWQR